MEELIGQHARTESVRVPHGAHGTLRNKGIQTPAARGDVLRSNQKKKKFQDSMAPASNSIQLLGKWLTKGDFLQNQQNSHPKKLFPHCPQECKPGFHTKTFPSAVGWWHINMTLGGMDGWMIRSESGCGQRVEPMCSH